MRTIEYDYVCVSTIERFSESNAFKRGLMGPFGSGKSSGCVMEIIKRGMQQAPSPIDGVRRTRWAAVRNSYPQLRDTTIKTVHDWLPPKLFGHWKVTDNDYTINKLVAPDGSPVEIIIMFRALDRPEHVSNLLSMELTGAWFNEAREIPKVIVDAMDGRVGRYPSEREGRATWHGIIMDTNPPDTDHWWFKYFEETRPENAAIFKQPSGLSDYAENLPNLPKDYYKNMAIGKDAEFIKVYVDGEYGFVQDGKPVYPNFKDSIHVAKEDLKPTRGLPLIIGFDFGLCYDDKTEVLTKEGWKFFKDVDEKLDQVATRNPETKNFEYTPINFKVDRPYKGKMLEWSNNSIDFCVTPEHRVPFTHRETPNKVNFIDAQWLANNHGGHHYVDLTSIWSAPPLCTKEEARFWGWYLSEGTCEKDTNRIKIYQYDNNSNMEKDLLAVDPNFKRFLYEKKYTKEQNGYKSGGWRVSNKKLADQCRNYGDNFYSKFIPDFIRMGNIENMINFLETYLKGDGHSRIRINKYGTKIEESNIFTVSEKMAGHLQEIIQKVGWHAHIRKILPGKSTIKEHNNPDGVIYNNGGFSISFRKKYKRAELQKEAFNEIQYNGRIYCLNVPYHTLYVRRNGKAHWNGNTPAAVIIQFTPKGKVLVLEEFAATNMSIRQLARDVLRPVLRTKYHGFEVVAKADPAGRQRTQTDERTCFQELKDAGISAVPSNTNSLIARIAAVDHFLRQMVEGEPAFVLSPNCKVLRRAFNGEYKYRRLKISGDERYMDVPEKNAVSHISDALQYALMEADYRASLTGITAIRRSVSQQRPPVTAFY